MLEFSLFFALPSPGAKDDGRQQPEGHPAAADRRQDHCVRRQGRGRQNFLRRVLLGGGQHRHPQKDGRRRLRVLTRRERGSGSGKKQTKLTYYNDIQVKSKQEGKTTTNKHTHTHTDTHKRTHSLTLLIASKESCLIYLVTWKKSKPECVCECGEPQNVIIFSCFYVVYYRFFPPFYIKITQLY